MISTVEALTVLVLTLAVLFWARRCQKRLDMPCPTGVPILGNLLQIDPEKPHFTFTDWSRKLGEIFCVRLCGQNLVVVNSFDAVHEVLADKGHDLAGRPRNFRARCLTNNFRNIGFCNPCPAWRMLRRAVHRDLKMFGCGFQRLEDITTGVVREMATEVATLGQDGAKAIDLRPLLYSATMNIMCVFLVGRRYRKTDEEFKLFQEMERLGVTLIASAGKGAELDAFPWLRWFGNETYERLVKFSKLRDDLYERLKESSIKEMRSRSAGGGLGEEEKREKGRDGVREGEAEGVAEILEKVGRQVLGGGEKVEGGREATEGGVSEIDVGERKVGGKGEGRVDGSLIDGSGLIDFGNERMRGESGEDEDEEREEVGGESEEMVEGFENYGVRGGKRGGRKGEGGEESGAIIQTLLKMVEESGEEGLDGEFIKGTFVDLILGGTASTTNLVYAYLNILLHHRSSYDRVKTEISHCLTDLDPDLIAQRPCLSDKAQMPYTQASVLELLRYVSIAPFTVPHHALVSTTIAGYKIPQGTEVLCNLWAVLHDEGIWDEPWSFRPQRFLTDDGASLVAPDHPNRRRLIAFSAGPRRCVGETFALSRLFLIVTSLLRDFDLYPNPEAELVSCDPRTYALGIALYPPDFKLRLTPTRFYDMQTV